MSSSYDKIKSHIQLLIGSGRLAANHKLPAERELTEQLQVTRITLREGLNRLEGEGLVYRQNRRGWFVAPNRFVMNPTQKVNFNSMARQQGFKAATKVLRFCKLTVRRDIYSAFNGTKSTKYFEMRRVRYLDQRAVMVEESYLSSERFSGLSDFDLSGAITEVLQDNYMVNITQERCNIQVANLELQCAEPLGIPAGAPGLKILRLRYDSAEHLIDYNIEYWLPHAIEMEVSTR
ncbi:UTRA domain-containing protein [Microbulbifer sp. 2205BS26-8]|uniref:UTRA domain-containing protein n=1 Tax=Microbulbifer sp. 2205BS26-8 TaxID=3064386 RepID=UPI00273D6802|nr:UTRA domain-containing protein [Microbulbifer sp. 2205BS26-8]MDP5210611.1 UTRA domain-containing protein [Microbulbifer sp. 2205BS26-8]